MSFTSSGRHVSNTLMMVMCAIYVREDKRKSEQKENNSLIWISQHRSQQNESISINISGEKKNDKNILFRKNFVRNSHGIHQYE